MMNEIDRRHQASIVPHAGGHLVQVGDKTYYLAELQPTPIQPQPINTGASLQTSPAPITDTHQLLLYLGLGAGAMVIALVGSWLFVKAVVPAPVPAATPTQPQTVIVQPPAPEKRPYRRRDCAPAGLFGWGSNCREETGYE